MHRAILISFFFSWETLKPGSRGSQHVFVAVHTTWNLHCCIFIAKGFAKKADAQTILAEGFWGCWFCSNNAPASAPYMTAERCFRRSSVDPPPSTFPRICHDKLTQGQNWRAGNFRFHFVNFHSVFLHISCLCMVKKETVTV